jgi:mevalonate kinase
MTYTTITYGKWILSGEHAVLRACPALVFPLGNYPLHLSYASNTETLIIEAEPTIAAVVEKIWAKAWSLLNQKTPGGNIKIQSNIPIGQGMGASAALCLAIARCVVTIAHSSENIFLLATQLEHLFHSQSSGLDIIGAGSTSGSKFFQGQTQPIHLGWQPHWRLSPSHTTGTTTEAVQKVQHFIKTHPQKAQAIDKKMTLSVELCLKALESSTPQWQQLKEGMQLACECFEDWGLINKQMKEKIASLYEQGALAVKPTGSGGGGFLLSLWENPIAPLAADDIPIILPVDKKFHSV